MRNKALLLSLAILLSLMSAFATDEDVYQEGVLYIKLKNNANHTRSDTKECRVNELLPQQESAIVKKYAIREYAYCMRLFDSDYLNNVYRIEFDSIQLTDKLIEELMFDNRIELVERVPVHTIPVVTKEDPIGTYLIHNNASESATPNDLFWGVIDGVHTSWFWDLIGFNEAYGVYTGNSETKVAIVDNAVWEEHEDLVFEYDNLYDTYLGIEGSAAPPKSASQDRLGWSHGTHCAGLIGALTNNGIGMASLSSGVSLMGVKAAESSSMDLARTVQGVIWAAENGAKIINMSYGSANESRIEREILESCVKNGIILIAAAGNSGKDMNFFPAQYEGIISVGSVNSDMKLSSFSNYGTWVDIAAPGGYYVLPNGELDTNSQILSATYCQNQTFTGKPSFAGKYYDMMVGTSMAAPVVSSLAALIISYYPNLNAYQLLEVLQRSATEISPTDMYINEDSGIINVPAAMGLLEISQNKYVKNLQAVLNAPEDEVLMEWTQPSEQAGISGYHIYENEHLIEELTNQLSYKIPYDESMADKLYGVKTIYNNGEGLISYTKISHSSAIDNSLAFEKDLRYYVNAGKLVLSSENEIGRITLFDIQGRKLIDTPYQAGGINISALGRGIYVLNAKYSTGGETIKIVL